MLYLYYLAILLVITQGECGRWLEPSSDTNIWANNTANGIIGEVTFEWKYTLDGGDGAINLVVSCGYYNGRDYIKVISKIGQTSSFTKTSSPVSGRVDVISSTNNNVASFKLRNVVKADQKSYGCLMLVTVASSTPPIQNVISKDYNLQVLDRPSLYRCLNNIPTVNAEKSITIDCYATGNPQPKLICTLFSLENKRLASVPSNAIPDDENITSSVMLIPKTAKEIVCTAEGQYTGSVTKTHVLNVRSTPFVVKNFQQISSTIGSSSIRLFWNRIPINETGGVPFRGYKLKWWVSSRFSEAQNSTIITLNIPGTVKTNNYYVEGEGVFWERSGFNPSEGYSFRVYGYNAGVAGKVDGDISAKVDAKPGFQGPGTGESSGTDSAEIGMIVGGVLGGIVVIVLVVVLVVYCSRKSSNNKRYPTSYVEDAVDYPPNQGHSLYAGVEKKQKPVSRSDSTSGYPDVVNNGNDFSMKAHNNSTSYEPSNKAYV